MNDRPLPSTRELSVRLPACLTRREDGAVVVTGHRVKLPLVLEAYRDRDSIDDVVRTYPTLDAELVEKLIRFVDAEPEFTAALLDEYDQRRQLAASAVETGPSVDELRERQRNATGNP